jgi:hypothetical protein
VTPGHRARFGWRIYTSRGVCRVIRRQDLQPGEQYLTNMALVRSEIAAWARDSAHARTLLELYQAAYGFPAWEMVTTQEVWIEERVEEAFRQGRLLLVPEKRKEHAAGGGGGGAVTQGSQTQEENENADEVTSSSGQGQSSSPPKTQEKTWFRAALKDEDGKPMKDEEYVLVDTDGTKREGKLDANGEVYIPPILPPGKCTITFPKIHLNPRKRKGGPPL